MTISRGVLLYFDVDVDKQYNYSTCCPCTQVCICQKASSTLWHLDC